MFINKSNIKYLKEKYKMLPSVKIKQIARELARQRSIDYDTCTTMQRNIFMTSALILFLDEQKKEEKFESNPITIDMYDLTQTI